MRLSSALATMLLGCACLTAGAGVARGQVEVRSFQKELTTSTGAVSTGPVVVRGMIARVDLSDARVSVHVSGSVVVNPDVKEPSAELIPTDEWARDHGMTLAVNGGYFSWVKSGARPIGLFVRDGEVLSASRVYRGGGGVVDPALVFLKSGGARVIGPGQGEVKAEEIAQAVAGVGASDSDPKRGTLVVQGGKNLGATARVFADERYARTGAGVDASGKVLVLVCVDGGQAGWSAGATLAELGEMLIAEGVWDGLNLDGGGSTSMIYREVGKDGAVVERTNRPSDAAGTEGGVRKFRPVPTHIGFKVATGVRATKGAFPARASGVEATGRPQPP